jgi:peptidoglycan/xylan/chitin deacetylase (PgdA/CDA1 family)
VEQSYLTKWLEILSVEENGSDSYFMNVEFVYGERVALKWKVDSFTADNIRHVIAEVESMDTKYRLTFQSERNVIDQQCYGQITQYNRNASRRMKFACSEQFAEQLAALKKINHISGIKGLTFFLNETYDGENDGELKKQVITETRAKIGNKLFINLVASFLIITLLAYLSFTGFSLIINGKVLANKDTVSAAPNESKEAQVVVTEKLAAGKRVQPAAKALSVTPPSAPPQEIPLPVAVSLDHLVNYNIPKDFVAITFDDGPSKYTKDIVDILTDYHVGGTFFFVGTQVKKFPEFVTYVDEHGFAIGNHSVSHANLQKLSVEKQRAEILGNKRLLENITSKPVLLFRPPYGSMNAQTKKYAEGANMKIVMWDCDPKDWKYKGNPQKVLNYIKNFKTRGSVILLHESKQTVEMLPDIIEFLQQQNVQIINLK